MKGLPDFFLAGCQKTASSWTYICLKEHPEIFVPQDTDTTHYFDMFYHLGLDWYRDFYQEYNGEKVIGDTTPSYIRDFKAPQRIAEFNGQAKLIFNLRNPINRAFSHYWHEKRKEKISFEFKECLENYDLYQDWITTGFYYRHLKRYLDYFPRENIKIMIFDDLKEDDQEFIQEIYRFLGVDDSFMPSVLNKKVNKADYVWDLKNEVLSLVKRGVSAPLEVLGKEETIEKIRNSKLKYYLDELVLDKTEYEQGIDAKTRRRLSKIFAAENKKLEEFLGRKLNWD